MVLKPAPAGALEVDVAGPVVAVVVGEVPAAVRLRGVVFAERVAAGYASAAATTPAAEHAGYGAHCEPFGSAMT